MARPNYSGMAQLVLYASSGMAQFGLALELVLRAGPVGCLMQCIPSDWLPVLHFGHVVLVYPVYHTQHRVRASSWVQSNDLQTRSYSSMDQSWPVGHVLDTSALWYVALGKI